MNHYSKDNFRLTQSIGFMINKARNILIVEMDAALNLRSRFRASR